MDYIRDFCDCQVKKFLIVLTKFSKNIEKNQEIIYNSANIKELKEMDEELICKLKAFLIYGEKEVDGINQDGKIEKIYKDGDGLHIDYMERFLKKHDLGANFDDDIKNRRIDCLYYELQKLGHIAFAEESFEDEKLGLIFMPNQITEKQKDSLKLLIEELKKENYMIRKFWDLNREDKEMIAGREKMGNPDIILDKRKESKESIDER